MFMYVNMKPFISGGLVRMHAYSVTKVVMAETVDGVQQPLVRLRNPWGNETEWKGAWSDGSEEWAALTDVRKMFGFCIFVCMHTKNVGMFWKTLERKCSVYFMIC
jgi:hypothetical protein